MTALKNGLAGILMPILQTLPDFIVNSSTTDFQVEPAITTLADGRVVMTWRSFDNGDGLSTCIRARIFNANGTPTGADFIVNSTATAAQSNPSVAVLANGNIVFSWESDDTADTSLGCIRTRIFTDTGTAVGVDFVSNTTTSGQQYAPTVTALTDGRFLLTWDHYGDEDGPGDEIHARLFNANGTPVAADFIANSTTTGIQSAASVSALSAGRFVMTWMSEDTGDGSLGAIRARIFNANGTAAGADFIVNSTATSDQVNPAVAVLADGRMVFTWQSYDSGDGDLSCIRARIYSAAGVALGTDFIVNTTTFGAQSDVAITTLADGRFVMAWASTDTGDGADGCIRARLYNLDGTPAGSDFIINTTAADYQFTPVLTALPNGTFQVAWMSLDTGDGSQSTIRSTIFNPNVFIGTPLADTWTGGNLTDTIYGNGGDDMLYGKDGADIIDGGNGNDHLWGGNGADQLVGGADLDFARYDDANYGNLTIRLDNSALNVGAAAVGDTYNGIEGLVGGAGNDTIVGNSANNYLYGSGGNDSIDGGAGNDAMVGGDGNDIYFVDNASDTVTETNAVLATGGDDLVNFSGTTGTYMLGANIERLTLLGSSAINGTGNALNNTIIGNTAANIIDGAAGNDTMNGGDGNDTYYVDSFSDVVSETNAVLLTGGNDLVYFSGTSGTFTVGNNIENLTLLGAAATNGTGNTLNNTLTGNSAANILSGLGGNDILDGGAGSDTMNGGDGDDIYYVDSFSDVVSETNAVLATGGNDLVYFSGTAGTFTAGTNIERLTLLGTAATNGTGNALNNTLTGNSAANTLSGLAGNDIIDGGAGNDTMIGGDGNDIYYADVTTDIITETNATLATGGDDLVYFTGTTGTFTLGVNVERLTLTGTDAISGTGNTLNNTIIGNSGVNFLIGGNGNDILDGGDGNDQLWGGSGSDQYIGGVGIDYARYDDANYGNLVIRLDNSGNTGTSAVGDTYVGIEGVVGGAGYDRIYGNAADNYLYGGDFYDDLYGGDGNDFMVGGDSDDWFYGGNGADTMDGGIDTFVDYARYDDVNYGNLTIRLDNSALNTGAAAGDVYINIEGVVGGAGNDTIYGNALVNNLFGQGGNDVIDGLAGSDNLWGSNGSDRFQFTTALNATTNVDRINDFAHGTDDIVLAQSIFFGIGVVLEASEFRLGTAAGDTNDFIIYNSGTGQLFYDANGSGAGGQTLFATVTAGTVLDINDFVVI
jgi:Ca2+-binding RTX toxin-like protein